MDLTHREIDALVEETLFSEHDVLEPLREDMKNGLGGEWDALPRYSTNYDRAWKVVEQMMIGEHTRRPFIVQLQDSLSIRDNMYARVAMGRLMDKLTPKIICLAALRVEGVDV